MSNLSQPLTNTLERYESELIYGLCFFLSVNIILFTDTYIVIVGLDFFIFKFVKFFSLSTVHVWDIHFTMIN